VSKTITVETDPDSHVTHVEVAQQASSDEGVSFQGLKIDTGEAAYDILLIIVVVAFLYSGKKLIDYLYESFIK
jgi:hypothetical protein